VNLDAITLRQRAARSALGQVQERLHEAQAHYAGARPSRFRRPRYGLGGTADAHYAYDYDFWQLREYARDMDRNDAIVGQLVDRAVTNIIGTGIEPDPSTGDPALNQEIQDRWREWAADPRACDASCRLSFHDAERLALRHVFIDGDIFALPIWMGGDAVDRFQLVEGDWCWSPISFAEDVVHGIRLDAMGRPVEFLFTKPQPGKRLRVGRVEFASDLQSHPALTDDGWAKVLHLYRPARVTQTRGVTAFHAVFDRLGMIEDVDFATLVKQQMAAMFAAFITQTNEIKFGSRSTQANAIDGTQQTNEGLSPGALTRLRAGEDIRFASSNIPGTEFLDHMRHLLRFVGLALGMPLTMVTLDTSNTTFHGYRGELNEYRKSAREIQTNYVGRLHRPMYRHNLRAWYPEWFDGGRIKPALRKRLAARFQLPGWPYVEPLTDAQADSERLANKSAAPRHIAAERGHDWDDIVRESVEDYTQLVEASIQAAQNLSEKYGVEVDWREIARIASPKGMTIKGTQAGAEPEPAPSPEPAAA